MQRWVTLFVIFAWAGVGASSIASAEIELKVARFFGACDEAGTDTSAVRGEACIMQAILNAFNEQSAGITVRTTVADWDGYYDQLLTNYARGEPPDLHIVHRHRIQEFVDLGLLASLGDDLVATGIDVSDWEPTSLAAVTVNGGFYGVPFDIHANLWHINLDLLAAAGLLGDDGRPILPTSPGELLERAAMVKNATGKNYLAADFTQFPIGTRAVLTLLWQQNKNVFEGKEATVDTAEMRAAITTITDLFDAGFADPTLDYDDAQQAFLDAEAAILINGTWAVNLYDSEASKAENALNAYDVASFPRLFETAATWADSHIWVIPASLKQKDPEAYQAALTLLAWIDDHNLDWARTGHVPVRTSVLESKTYRSLPHRIDYLDTPILARNMPMTTLYDAIQEAIDRGLQAIWLGRKPIDDALADAEIEVQSLLQ